MAALPTTSPPILAALVMLLTSCSDSSGGASNILPRSEFVVLGTNPADNGSAFLNDTINFDFSNPVDINSASLNAITFAVTDLYGDPTTEPVSGTFHLETSPGDTVAGRRLQFRPTFPRNDTFSDGGLRAGRVYRVQLVEGKQQSGIGLRDVAQQGLNKPFAFTFRTVTGSKPSQLFRDTRPGGPRRTGLRITPRDPVTGQVALNELGQQGVEIRLDFDQPLNPSSTNLPVGQRGPIYLLYDGRSGKDIWIPADVSLEHNSLEGSTVVMRPLGILPNHATIRIIVEDTLEDMSGESNTDNSNYDRRFGSFETHAGYELRFDAVVEDFDDASRLDLGAPFLEPLAEILPGALRAALDFEGKDTNLVYEPNDPEVVLNTDFTRITPKNAPDINVAGGVFEFRSVTIPEGVTVRSTGSKPMVWLVLEDFVVKGRLLCDGGDGQRVVLINSANKPAAGGIGSCGGGNGGQGSPNTTGRSLFGETGFGPDQKRGGGGRGGQIACSGSCNNGSGGGGGSHATKGDPWYKVKASGATRFIQQKGQGGYGCKGASGAASRTLPGGLPGPAIFTDPQVDNDFWGSAINVWLQKRVIGELAAPVGGSGGGGGGDHSVTGCNISDPSFANDNMGGGGGAGGGVIIVKALGSIRIDRNGLISTNGGNGGGGAFAGGNGYLQPTGCGGGGGGSGGMIVLMAGVSIDIVIHGSISSVSARNATYAGNNLDFAVSADGGCGLFDSTTGGIRGKYDPTPSSSSASIYDAVPTGALGGMGVIQLMAPPGNPSTPNVDGTNTVLDDNINFHVGSFTGEKVLGSRKMELLAWRGMPDENGTLRDDNGNVLDLGDNDGDMRPSPTLLPTTFNSRSRMRSKWIDRGAVVRRMTPKGGDGLPGGVEVQPGLKIGDDFGPEPFFSGTDARSQGSPGYGYIAYENDNGNGVRIPHNTVATGSIVASSSTAVHKGQKAYEVQLSRDVLGSEPDRYAHYAAQLLVGRWVVAEFRILGHNANTLYLETDNQLTGNDNLPEADTVKVLDKFFYVFTGSFEGLTEAYKLGNGVRAPTANIRIGFAFHKNPGNPDLSIPGEDQNRFPKRLGTFLYDMNSPDAIGTIRSQHFRYLRWDLLFDTLFQADPRYPQTRTPGPLTKRPEIRRLVIPYRY